MARKVRRKALVIMGFTTPDEELSGVEEGYSRDYKKQGKPQITPTFSSDFLIARDKQHKRPGFFEIELLEDEAVMQALYRFNPWSQQAITRPWERIAVFRHKGWSVQVGIVGVHEDQRRADLYEQSDELPYTVEWQDSDWLSRQNNSGILSHLTSVALCKEDVRNFLQATQHRRTA